MNNDTAIASLEAQGIEILSREDFIQAINQATESSDPAIKDLAINAFDRLPSFIKSLKNFDPTGVAAYIADTIAEEKAKRDAKRDLEIIYQFYLGMKLLDLRLKILDGKTKEKIPLLNDAYIRYSSQVFREELIRSFRNVWCNSILNNHDDLEEQLQIFDLLETLTIDHIKILEKFDSAFKSETRAGIKPSQEGVLSVGRIVSELGFDIQYTQMLCLSLVGKGLLMDASAQNPALGIAGSFRIGDYFNTFLKYVLDP